MSDLVSVIMPSYKSSQFIKEAVNSVIAQSYSHWELIIVDDCSPDNSVEIIETIVQWDNRIHFIALAQNVGAAEARNIALRKANGRYIAFLDSDDIWYPEKLSTQLVFMEKSNHAFTFSAYEVIAEDGQIINSIKVPSHINYNQYLRNTIIGCLTVVIDKDQTGYFEMPNIRSSHDMALWLSLLKKGIIAYGYNQRLAAYRVVSTSNTSKKYKAASDVWRVYREIENLSLLKSTYCMIGYAFNAIIKRL